MMLSFRAVNIFACFDKIHRTYNQIPGFIDSIWTAGKNCDPELCHLLSVFEL